MQRQRIKLEFLIHDLKVPLAVIEAGIQSLIQKMDKYGPLTERQMKVLERALRNTIVTKTLVNDVLELGRSGEGIISKARLSPSSFIEDALVQVLDLTDHATAEKVGECSGLSALQNTLSQVGIILEADEKMWKREVFLDESKIKQIVRNLLNNALKYRKQRIELKLWEDGRFLVISVKDDGEGIPADYHNRIFECYFQMDMRTDHCVRGHGLGLAGVQVLLEDMGGEMSLESDAGKGATFVVKIPL